MPSSAATSSKPLLVGDELAGPFAKSCCVPGRRHCADRHSSLRQVVDVGPEAPDDVARGTEFLALLDYIDPDLEERGLVNGAIIGPDREKESLLEFLAEVSTAWNQVEMKRVQHADRGRRWRDNDHYDINPFSVALTYCDALVAEGHWADKIRRADLQTLNECELMTTVEELRLYLAGL